MTKPKKPTVGKLKPNPGSPAAIKHWCACTVIDNHHGNGLAYGPYGEVYWWMSEDCPLHGKLSRFDKRGEKNAHNH